MPTLKFRPFQIEQLARAAMRDGLILSWEQGLGKGLAAFAWPLIKEAKRVLLVAPGGLHGQLQKEAVDKFGVWVTPINQDNLDKFRLHKPIKETGATRFFITSYEDLGLNGGDEWAPEKDADGSIIMDDRMSRRMTDPTEVMLMELAAKLTGEKLKFSKYFEGIGHKNDDGIRCIWRPTMATRLQALQNIGGGFDCVVVDEGTRLQATESHIGVGVRKLNPKMRCVLTGTPIKNRLESFFWLAHWAAGGSAEPTSRWPYPGTSEARCEFADQHLHTERFVTREAERSSLDSKWRGRISKLTPRISNIHKFWKLSAPIMLRLRKDECGQSIVPKIIKPVNLQPGEEQQQVYKYFVENQPVENKLGKAVLGRTPIGMQLNYLRQAALCPHAQTLGDARCKRDGKKQSSTVWNPKLAATLSLVHEILAKGEQVIIGSPFTEFSATVHAKLLEAGISSVLLDGGTSPKKRGQLAAAYKKGHYRVMVAGLKAMAEGHSFECANHLILPSLSFAYDENEQFIHRVWRLTSTKPVYIYPLRIVGTVDDKLLQLFSDKGDAANLALDGRLVENHVDDVDMAQLLAEVLHSYRPTSSTVSEEEMIENWPTLCAKIRSTTNLRMAA